jgi:hypothetical protein
LNVAVNSSPPASIFFAAWIVVALACMTCGIFCLRRHRLLGWLCIAGVVIQVALVVGLPLLMKRWSMMPNQGAAANRRPARQSDGSGSLSAIVAADRAFPAAVAERDR